jgi:hypothetical protein
MALVFYEGISEIDGITPIRGYITGLDSPSSNRKTGDMFQTWILLSEISPVDAAKYGNDSAICGDCPHRPSNDNTCYVLLHQAPSAIWKSNAQKLNWADPKLQTRPIRLGSYGDPTAIPYDVWDQLTDKSQGHTGYTHNWKKCDQRFKELLMASVDNVNEMLEAQLLGWRTYRVKTEAAPVYKNETYCPSATGVQCQSCKLCSGNTIAARSITIDVHGTTNKITAFNRVHETRKISRANVEFGKPLRAA